MNVVEASGLGKRYGGTWALRECSLAIPAGHVAALVGPNGAGKTTLLNLAVGLAEPSAGGVTVLGGHPAGAPAGRPRDRRHPDRLRRARPVSRPRSASPSTGTRGGRGTSPAAGSGPSSGSKAAGCARCQCCSSPRPSGWSAAGPRDCRPRGQAGRPAAARRTTPGAPRCTAARSRRYPGHAAAQTPTARVHSAGGNVPVIVDSVAGITSPALSREGRRSVTSRG